MASKDRQHQRAKRHRRKTEHRVLWWILLGPALLLFAVFIYLPVILVTVLSLFDWNLVSPTPAFVGTDNYAEVVLDGQFGRLIWQSVVYILLALVGNMVLPVLLAAVTLTVGKRIASVYHAVYFLPTVVATVVAALVWNWIYLPLGGPLNALLGAGQTNWLGDPRFALLAISIIGNWKFFGFSLLITLAGISAIAPSLIEAARIDGASTPKLWWNVMLPQLTPTLVFLLLTVVLRSLADVFVPIQVLTQGGPSGRSSNLLYAVYQQAFEFFRVGPSSVLAVITMVLLGGIAVWQFLALRRRSPQ